MKHLVLLGIILLSFCSCKDMVQNTKTLNKFRNELKAQFPNESIGVLHKLNKGHFSINCEDTDDISDDLNPNTIVIVFKNTELEGDEQFMAEDVLGQLIKTTKSVFGDQVKHGKLVLSDNGFIVTSSRTIDFDIE